MSSTVEPFPMSISADALRIFIDRDTAVIVITLGTVLVALIRWWRPPW